MTGRDPSPDLPGGPLPQLDAMLRESDLDDDGLGAALGHALAPLVPDGSAGPAPSAALALLLGPGPRRRRPAGSDPAPSPLRAGARRPAVDLPPG